MNQNEKKRQRLGMNISSAVNRLLRDTLFKFVKAAGQVCFRCGKELDRDSFTIDHKKNWLNSDTPKELYFDQSNIAFSHVRCNARHTDNYLGLLGDQKRLHGNARRRAYKARNYTPANRHEKYLRTGT